MRTERIQAAPDALVSVGVPENAIQPCKDVLGERRAKTEQTYDPAKRLEQLTAARNKLAKRREDLQADFDDQKAKLERAEQLLQQTSQDLDILQSQTNQATAESNETAGATNLTSQAPTGLRAIQAALQQPDDELAKNPEHAKYAATTVAAGSTPTAALRWHLSRELGPLAADEPQPAPKRACIGSAARTTDADGDDVL